ncbi:MAG: VWA domain-containing protein [Acidobacteria bacterium]|nr:VWA domain-containing protein [Acidobacteriota bacterium]
MTAATSSSPNVVTFHIPLLARRTWHLLASNAAATVLVLTAAAIPAFWSILRDEPPEIRTPSKIAESHRRDIVLPQNYPLLSPPGAGADRRNGVRPASEEEKRRLESLGYIGGSEAGGKIDETLGYQSGSFNTESYDRLDENPFLTVASNPLSTFSIDVDSASYSNVRRFLNEGRLPPKDAVRIEEMVNYFEYDYPQPEGDDPFAVMVDVATAPWAPSHRLARIGLKGREVPVAERPASNLVFLVDVSGSMEPPNKLPLLKRAMSLLVDNLTDRDRVAIVVYAGASGLVLPSTSCEAREEIHRALDRLEAGGSTNGGSGIKLAYDVASECFIDEGINRVILATDGDFNVGVTDQGELTRLIETEAKRGVFLSVLGFGMGNYKDSTLEKLADRGNGNYAYIDTISEARKVLLDQLSSRLITIAKDVKIQVEFNPLQVASYRLIGYENRALRAEDFNDDAKDAGEIGAGHTVTALYELIPPGVGPVAARGVDPLRYQTTAKTTGVAGSGELLTVRLRYKDPQAVTSRLIERQVRDEGVSFERADEDLRFAAAVAAFGMVLRESPHKGSATLEAAIRWARESVGTDRDGYRAGFIELVRVARTLTNS